MYSGFVEGELHAVQLQVQKLTSGGKCILKAMACLLAGYNPGRLSGDRRYLPAVVLEVWLLIKTDKGQPRQSCSHLQPMSIKHLE